VPELRPGVWHWRSPHPDRDEEHWWPELGSYYGIELGGDFQLFDPLSVPDELHERATAVVMTAPYQRARRSTAAATKQGMIDTLGAIVPPDGSSASQMRRQAGSDRSLLP
jgi:hypothetical protein